MASTTKFKINGVIDTGQPVFENIELLATSAGCFITWDPIEGKWSVIVNEAGSSVFSFNDTNILGAITLGGSGVNELYNSCEIEFPHKDLRDAVDYLTVSIPSGDRFANELDNQLSIKLNTINDPIQAQIIASQELKQNRVDKVIEFQSDFTANGIKAGDLVDVTNTALAYTAKLFRVIQVSEEDRDDGAIIYNITALEYDSNVYNVTGLTYDYRTKNNGIPSKIVNDEIVKSDAQDIGDTLKRLLIANIAAGLFNPNSSGLLGNILKSVFDIFTDDDGDPVDNDGTKILEPNERIKDKILGRVKIPGLSTISGPSTVCEGDTVTITVTSDCTNCLFDIPPINYSYTITGISGTDISIPLTGNVLVTNGTGSLSFTVNEDGTVESPETMTITIGSLTKVITIYDKLGFTYLTNASPTTLTEGGSSTVTLITSDVPDGTNVPYTITGDGAAKVTTPLTGFVVVNSDTALLTINTTGGDTYGQTITVTFSPDIVDYCGELDRTVTLTIQDTTLPAPVPACEFITVPVVWCGEYSMVDQQLTGMTASFSMQFPKPLAGEATIAVPLTVSVTKGNPSTVTITSTANIAASSSIGGLPASIITSFNTVAPRGLITGTTQTAYGKI